MQAEALTGGFDDAPVQSARAFRLLLEVMARPGLIQEMDHHACPPAPLSAAAGIALLTLADGDTPILLAGDVDCPEVRDWITFHIGAPIRRAGEAADMPPVFACGTLAAIRPCMDGLYRGAPDYPDRSTTILLEVERLTNDGARLTGPGIASAARLSLPETALFMENHREFPLGHDFFLTCGNRIAGLPRSTKVEAR